MKKNKKTNENGMPEMYSESEKEPSAGFKDRFAMWLSGMLVVGLPCIALIFIILLVTYLFFGGLQLR